VSEKTLFSRIRLASSPLMIMMMVVMGLVLLAGTAQAADHGGQSETEILMQTLYQGANLALLLGTLFYFGRKPITEFFSTRRSGIQSELTEAAELLAEAEKRNAELQRRLVDLGSEVEGIQEEAGRRAEEEAERIMADARATAERIRRDAQAAVAQELRRAQVELREEAADLALEIAGRKLNEQVGEADRERLVDEFILRVEPPAAEGTRR
jgi:F-type H+-transporting ATPase subunit b